jgi:hypothetical protein
MHGYSVDGLLVGCRNEDGAGGRVLALLSRLPLLALALSLIVSRDDAFKLLGVLGDQLRGRGGTL